MAAVLLVGDLPEARDLLEKAGLAVVVADEVSVAPVNVLPFDAVIVAEGDSDPLLHLLQRAAWEGKLVCGIGKGILALARAELLEGEHAAFPADEWTGIELDRHGAMPMPGDIVDDGQGVITAKGPEAAIALAERVIARLGYGRTWAAATDFGLA